MTPETRGLQRGRESTLSARKKREKKNFQGAASSMQGEQYALPCKQSGPEILGKGLGSQEDRKQAVQALPFALGGARPARGLDRRRPRPPASGLLSQAQDSPIQTTPEGRTDGVGSCLGCKGWVSRAQHSR